MRPAPQAVHCALGPPLETRPVTLQLAHTLARVPGCSPWPLWRVRARWHGVCSSCHCWRGVSCIKHHASSNSRQPSACPCIGILGHPRAWCTMMAMCLGCDAPVVGCMIIARPHPTALTLGSLRHRQSCLRLALLRPRTRCSAPSLCCRLGWRCCQCRRHICACSCCTPFQVGRLRRRRGGRGRAPREQIALRGHWPTMVWTAGSLTQQPPHPPTAGLGPLSRAYCMP